MTDTTDNRALSDWLDTTDDKDEPYLDHLNDDTFKESIRFRIRGKTDDTMLPSFDIGNVLREDFDLDQPDTFNVALVVDENRAEYAFDAAAVDAAAALNAVHELIERYNQPPEDLPVEKHDEWTDVRISDVQCRTDD